MENLYLLEIVIVMSSGLILGSFFNVLIYRMPKGESVIWPGSRCPLCKRPLRPIENIPVISYIFLRGKCAGCKGKISLQYPLIEFITLCLTLLLWQQLFIPFTSQQHPWWEFLSLFLQILSLLILIPVSVIDLRHYIIPDSITLGGLVLGVVFSLIPGTITPAQSALGILAGGGTLFGIGLIGQYILRKGESMGGGDIKLMAFIGAVWGWKISFLSITFGALLGSIAGLGLIIIKLLPRGHKIPFGPFLSVGTLIAVFFGMRIARAYFAFVENLFF